MLTENQTMGLEKGHLQPYQQHWLHPQALAAFKQMQLRAQEDGVDLQLVSSFRDFQRQLSIWNRKWHGELPLYDCQGTLLATTSLTAEQKMHAILLWSALPGASRHHWGTDVDVYDQQSILASQQDLQLINSEYQLGGPCYKLALWLDKHAVEFDFYRPYADYQGGVGAEPWHLSYYPVARQAQQALKIEALSNAIKMANMAGKEVVLAQLPMLFERYILNVSDYG